MKFLTIHKKSVKSLLSAIPYLFLSSLLAGSKQTAKGWITLIDKCYRLNKDKLGCIYFALIPKLWPMQVYKISLTKIETMECLISKHT